MTAEGKASLFLSTAWALVPVEKVCPSPLVIDGAPYVRSLTTDSILTGAVPADLLLALKDLLANMVRVLEGKSDLFKPIP